MRLYPYQLAFAEGDTAAMSKEVVWAAGKAGIEDQMLENESLTAAYHGQLQRSRDPSLHAINSAKRAGQAETAAIYAALTALHEALLGNFSEAKGGAAPAIALSGGQNVEYVAAVALAVAGDTARAQSLAAGLTKQAPEDTLVNSHFVPTINAQIALRKSAPDQAIEALHIAAPYELGQPTGGLLNTNLFSVYVRGQAYLAAKQALKQSLNSRRSWITAVWFSTALSVRLLTSALRAPMHSPVMWPNPASPTKTSSPSGVVPTPTSRSSSKPDPNPPPPNSWDFRCDVTPVQHWFASYLSRHSSGITS